nr:TetR/AcrR family transcriptional regulator [Halomonas utahensis]
MSVQIKLRIIRRTGQSTLGSVKPVNDQQRPTRIHKSPEQRRREVLEAAAAVFSEVGFRCTEMDRIAERAGAGKGTVYRCFQGKEALFMATVEKALEDLTCYVNDVVDPLEDPLEQLRMGIHRYLEFFEQNPETVELFIQERAEFPRNGKPLYFVYQESHREKWRQRFETLIEQGRMRSDMSPALAQEVFSDLLYGAVFSQRLAGDRESRSRKADEIVDLLFRGILRPDSHSG